MINLQTLDVRTFLPAQDFEQSKAFYTALGCKIVWSDAHIALLDLSGFHFYLQRYYVQEWAENCMLQLSVANATDCFTAVSELLQLGQFPTARVNPPQKQPYGALVTYVWDPSGVLLHLTQWDAT